MTQGDGWDRQGGAGGPAETTRSCPQGHANPPGSLFCGDCGSELVAPEVPAAPTIAVPTTGQQCPNGHDVPAGARFCGICGSIMASSGRFAGAGLGLGSTGGGDGPAADLGSEQVLRFRSPTVATGARRTSSAVPWWVWISGLAGVVLGIALLVQWFELPPGAQFFTGSSGLTVWQAAHLQGPPTSYSVAAHAAIGLLVVALVAVVLLVGLSALLRRRPRAAATAALMVGLLGLIGCGVLTALVTAKTGADAKPESLGAYLAAGALLVAIVVGIIGLIGTGRGRRVDPPIATRGVPRW